MILVSYLNWHVLESLYIIIIIYWHFLLILYLQVDLKFLAAWIAQRTKGFAATWAEGTTPIAVPFTKDIMIGRSGKNENHIKVQTEF